MGVANKYNKMNVFTFKAPDSFEYWSLEDLFESEGAKKVHTVKAMYINHKSKYGDAPVIVTDTCLVNFPNHMTETVEAMLQDDEVIEAVNSDKLGFMVYSYKPNKVDKLCYGATWVDID